MKWLKKIWRRQPPAPVQPLAAGLLELAENDELLEAARQAIEDVLVDFRDSRIALMGRGNGLVIRECNGEDSKMIRLGPETAMRIGLKAIAAKLSPNPREARDGDGK